MISIRLNGEPRDVSDGMDLAKMLESLSLPSQHVAVEVNGNVIRRVDWPATDIKDGDKIELIHFVGGG